LHGALETRLRTSEQRGFRPVPSRPLAYHPVLSRIEPNGRTFAAFGDSCEIRDMECKLSDAAESGLRISGDLVGRVGFHAI